MFLWLSFFDCSNISGEKIIGIMKANHQQNQEQSASITGIRDSKPNGG